MSDMKLQVVNNEKYYNIISLRYGADIATLIKLRLNEINRLVVDELDRNGAQNAELTSPQNRTLLFLNKVNRLLKKDRELNDMYAEDTDLKLWIVASFLAKPFTENTVTVCNELEGKTLKFNALPMYFINHAVKCNALPANTPFVTAFELKELGRVLYTDYKCIGKTKTGLSIVQCPDSKNIYLYGKVNEEYESEYDDMDEKFGIKYLDWDANENKYYLVKVANNLNDFVEEFLE